MAFYRPHTIRDYVELGRRILRRKWLVLGVFLLTMGISTALVWRMPKMYKSTAMILIQPGQMNTAALVNLNLEARLRTLRPVITSRTELENIVRELNLYPEMRAGSMMDDVVQYARRNIEVLVQGRDLFQVSFVHENPKMAQMVAERLSRKAAMDETTIRSVFHSGWPEAASRAEPPTARPMTTATRWSKTRFRSTTSTPPCCTFWASTTNCSPSALADATCA